MSSRKTILVSRKVDCDGGRSPNAYVPHITVELRAAFPPNTVTREQVMQILDEVGREFGYQLAEALPPEGTWRSVEGREGPNGWLRPRERQ